MKLSDLNPGEFQIEEQTPSIETSTALPTKSLKLSEIDDYEVEQVPEAVSPEELNDSESLADKAYRLVDVAGEGLSRGWKSEIQSGIENVLLPYYFGDEQEQREGFERYEPSKQKYQEFTDQTKKMMPRLSYATELGAGLLPYALGGPATGVLANAALGGVEGAVTSGGYSDNNILSDEFKEDVAKGGAIGTVLGGAGTKLMKVAPKIGTAGLITAAATPLLTGEQDPYQMVGMGGTAALLTALATRGRKTSISPSGILGRAYQYGKEGVDLTSKEGLDLQTQKLANTATTVGKLVDEISNTAGKQATDTIFNEFNNQINELGGIISKGAQDKDSVIGSLKTKVWKDLETHIQKFKASHPGREVDIGEVFENATNSLRKGVKESITDPAELQAANKTIDIINDIGKIKDNQVSITLKQLFSPLGGKPKVTTLIEGVDDPVERQVLQNLSPDELKQAGFQQTQKPFKTVETPETQTSIFGQSELGESSLVKKVNDVETQKQRTVFGTAPEEVLSKRLETPFQPTAPSTFLNQSTQAAQKVEFTNSVFERLFPGRSDLTKVSLPEILDANVRLNEVIKSSRSDFSKRVLLDAKKRLAQKEQELVTGTEFTDVVSRRELYGALKDAENLLKTDDVSHLFKLVDDMSAAQQQGRFQDFEKSFSSIRSINPEYASNLENLLLEKGGKWRNLVARQKTSPLEKLQTLSDEGLPVSKSALSAGQTIQDVESLKKMAGSISPKTGQPSTEAYKFAQNLGELRGPKAYDPKVRAELKEALKILKDYDPDLASRLENEGAKDADILRMIKIIRGESDIGFIPSTFQGAVIKILQVFGVPKAAFYTGKGVSAVNKYAGDATKTVLGKTEQVKNFLNKTQADTSFKSGNLGKYENALRSAMERGDGSLRATIYMLSQQYPDFREYMEQFSEE